MTRAGAPPSMWSSAPSPCPRWARWRWRAAGSRYYFDRSTYDLSNVRFRPSKDATGPYAINFTVYNDANESFYGVLTITVQQYAGNLDVLYTTSKDMPVTLDGNDFADFWNKSYHRGALIRVTFTELPSTYEGSLYTGYASNARPGTRIKSRDTFYMDPGNSQYGIDDLTFVPGVRQGEYVAVPFEADEQNPGSEMEIGYITRRNIILSEMGERYIEAMKRYLGI